MEHASLSQHAALDDNEDATEMSYIFSGGISRVEQITEPQPNMIESSAGFSVRVLGRTGLRYQEGGRSVWVDSEVLAKPHAIAMYKDSIKYWEGSDPDKVSDADRDRIANNIKRAFEACGYELQVQVPDYEWIAWYSEPSEAAVVGRSCSQRDRAGHGNCF